MKKPVISVIMPVYKAERTLARALDSFLAQDIEEPVELIMGVSSSDKESYEIAKQYEKKHKNIHVASKKERMSCAGGRLEAFQISRGTHICFMDADDELAPNYLSTLYKKAIETDADCVNCSFYEVTSNGKVKKFPFAKNSSLDKYSALNAFFSDISFRGFVWTKMFKRDVLLYRPILLLRENDDLFEDVPFTASLLEFCDSVVTIKDPLYYYHKDNPASLTTTKRTDRAQRHLWTFALIRHHFNFFNDEKLLKLFAAHRLRFYLSLKYDLKIDKKNGASKEYLKSVMNEWKIVKNMKKPLQTTGVSYSQFLKRTWLG